MPRGFAENTSTHTRHRLSFDVDRLLGRSEIMPRGIKKGCGKCIHIFTLTPRGRTVRQKLLRLDAALHSRCNVIFNSLRTRAAPTIHYQRAQFVANIFLHSSDVRSRTVTDRCCFMKLFEI
jgi:hypothetical protein